MSIGVGLGIPVSPDHNGTTENGDIALSQDKTPVALTYIDNVTGVVGSGGGGGPYYAMFFRFEVPIPAGSIIEEAKLLFKSAGLAGTDATMTCEGGFIKRDGYWENATGIVNWPDTSYVPFAEWNFGANYDATVYWGDAPAFTGVSIAKKTGTNQEWSFYDNWSTFGTASAPGIIAQLQDYLDDPSNEATRGSGNDPDSIPVCFQLFRLYNGSSNSFEWFRSSDYSGPLARPFLQIVYYTPTALGSVEASSSATLDVDLAVREFTTAELSPAATLDVDLAVQEFTAAELAAAATLDVGLAVDQFVASELSAAATLDSSLAVRKFLTSNLSSSALLDLDLVVQQILTSEISTAATLDVSPAVRQFLSEEFGASTTLDVTFAAAVVPGQLLWSALEVKLPLTFSDVGIDSAVDFD